MLARVFNHGARSERQAIQRPNDKQIGEQAQHAHGTDVEDGVIKRVGVGEDHPR